MVVLNRESSTHLHPTVPTVRNSSMCPRTPTPNPQTRGVSDTLRGPRFPTSHSQSEDLDRTPMSVTGPLVWCPVRFRPRSRLRPPAPVASSHSSGRPSTSTPSVPDLPSLRTVPVSIGTHSGREADRTPYHDRRTHRSRHPGMCLSGLL